MDHRLLPIGRRFLLVSRHVFEIIDGQLPIDAYGELGGPAQRIAGVGGDASLRGLPRSRYQDDVRYLGGYEIHHIAATTFWLGQFIQWRLIGFLDTGRVFHKLSGVKPAGLHHGVGGGIHVLWDEDFIVRLEVVRADRDVATLLRLSRSY